MNGFSLKYVNASRCIWFGIALLVVCKLTIGCTPTSSSKTTVIDCSKVKFDTHKYEIDDPNVTGFMLKILDPPVLNTKGITVTLKGIARLKYHNTTPPSHDKIAMILQSESLPRKHEIRAGDIKFTDGSAGRAGGGSGHGDSVRRLYADFFDIPPTGDKSLKEYTATIAYEPKPARHKFGPYTLNDLSKPIIFGKGKPILALADLSVVQKPLGYTNYDLGAFGSNLFLELPKPKLNYQDKYLVAQLYFAVREADSAESYHIYVYGIDGRRIELQQRAVGNGLPSSFPDPWIKSYDGLSVEQIAVKPLPFNRASAHKAPSMTPPNTRVVAVDPNGPACKAGIRPGDILVYTDQSHFYSGGSGTGTSKPMTIIRNGQKRTVTVIPSDDPLFTSLRDRREIVWEQLEKHLPNVHARALWAEGYASEEPVPVGFRPEKLEIWFDTPHVRLSLKNAKSMHFTFQNIPIPPQFWNNGSEQKNK